MIPLRVYKTRFSTLRTRVQRLALSSEMKSGVAAIRAAQQSQGCGKYEPVKFECSIAKRWAEQGSWTAEGLQRDTAGAVARLTVKRSLDRFFMYSEDGRTDLLKDDEQRQAATEVLEMGVGEFVQACASQSAHATTALPPADRPADRPAEEATTTNTNKKSSTPEAPTGQPPLFHYYHYFTSRLPHPSLCFGGARCPDSWAEYVVDEDGQERVGREQRGYPSVWLGGRGSATQAHYDVMHNSFVQLSGFKRFKLWPPTAHFALKVYPDAHPRARKARVAIPSAGEPPLAVPAVPAPFLDVVLAPGDALFVPAFWFHHVQVVEAQRNESEDGGLSVSINVFSQARVTNQLVEHVLGNSELLSALPQGLNAESSGGHLDLNRRLNAFATLAHAFVEHALFPESDAFAPTPHGGDDGGSGGVFTGPPTPAVATALFLTAIYESRYGSPTGNAVVDTEAERGGGKEVKATPGGDRGRGKHRQEGNSSNSSRAVSRGSNLGEVGGGGDPAAVAFGVQAAGHVRTFVDGLVQEFEPRERRRGGDRDRDERGEDTVVPSWTFQPRGLSTSPPNGGREYARGVAEIGCAHLLELVALRSFGAGSVGKALARAAATSK